MAASGFNLIQWRNLLEKGTLKVALVHGASRCSVILLEYHIIRSFIRTCDYLGQVISEWTK